MRSARRHDSARFWAGADPSREASNGRRGTRLRIAAFISHPIQNLTPLWQELSQRSGVELTVFYFSRHGVVPTLDTGFGVAVAWDIDLLAGHRHVFLPRQWPTRDPFDFGAGHSTGGSSRRSVRGGTRFVAGYAHANNWLIVAACKLLGIPVICSADTTLRSAQAKSLPKRLLKRLLLTPFVRQTAAFLGLVGKRERISRIMAPDRNPFRSALVPSTCPDSMRRSLGPAPSAGSELKAGGGSRRSKVVVFCGKLVQRKRPLDLLRAVEATGRSDLIALFVGDGELREQILALGGDRVRVTGFVNQSEIPLALSLADVFVLPSSFEPYGIVASEAQCLGIPAIVSDACGCHGEDSVVAPGVSGFVYPTGDVAALASRIETLLADEALHRDMSRQALRQGETQSKAAAADGFLAAVDSRGSQASAERRASARFAPRVQVAGSLRELLGFVSAIVGRAHAEAARAQTLRQGGNVAELRMHLHRDPPHAVEPRNRPLEEGELRAFDVDLEEVHAIEAVALEQRAELDDRRRARPCEPDEHVLRIGEDAVPAPTSAVTMVARSRSSLLARFCSISGTKPLWASTASTFAPCTAASSVNRPALAPRSTTRSPGWIDELPRRQIDAAAVDLARAAPITAREVDGVRADPQAPASRAHRRVRGIERSRARDGRELAKHLDRVARRRRAARHALHAAHFDGERPQGVSDRQDAACEPQSSQAGMRASWNRERGLPRRLRKQR